MSGCVLFMLLTKYKEKAGPAQRGIDFFLGDKSTYLEGLGRRMGEEDGTLPREG